APASTVPPSRANHLKSFRFHPASSTALPRQYFHTVEATITWRPDPYPDTALYAFTRFWPAAQRLESRAREKPAQRHHIDTTQELVTKFEQVRKSPEELEGEADVGRATPTRRSARWPRASSGPSPSSARLRAAGP